MFNTLHIQRAHHSIVIEEKMLAIDKRYLFFLISVKSKARLEQPFRSVA